MSNMAIDSVLAQIRSLSAQGAGQGVAHPQLMFAGTFLIEQRVESNDTYDVRGSELEPLGHELDHVVGNPVVVRVLAKMQNRDARRHFIGVARQDFVELLLRFRAEGECHKLSEGCGAAIFPRGGSASRVVEVLGFTRGTPGRGEP